jgi:hypothetical protein
MTAVSTPKTIRRLVYVDDMRHLGCYIPKSQCGRDLAKLYARGEGGNGDYFQPGARRNRQGISAGLNRTGRCKPGGGFKCDPAPGEII